MKRLVSMTTRIIIRHEAARDEPSGQQRFRRQSLPKKVNANLAFACSPRIASASPVRCEASRRDLFHLERCYTARLK
jgi:hypothetical protein